MRAVLTGLLTLGLLQVFLAPSARAVYYTTPPVTSPPIPLTQTNWDPTTASLGGTDPFKIQQFDASKYTDPNHSGLPATLIGVGIELDYKFINQITMRFDNVSTISVTANGIMHLTMPDGVTDLVGTPTFAAGATITSSTSDMFSKFVTLDPTIKTGSSKMGYTDSTTLSAFTGTGTINLPVFATAVSTFTTSSGNGAGTSLTSASAAISVVYFYSFVPEPSSMALTGLGGVGLLMACRKRVLRKD